MLSSIIKRREFVLIIPIFGFHSLDIVWINHQKFSVDRVVACEHECVVVAKIGSYFASDVVFFVIRLLPKECYIHNDWVAVVKLSL